MKRYEYQLYAIILFFIGVFLSGGILGFKDPYIQLLGFITFFAALATLMCPHFIINGKNLLHKSLGLMFSIFFIAAFFCFLCLFGAVPFMPTTPEALSVYKAISYPLLLIGGIGGGGESAYIVKTKKNAKGEEEVVSVEKTTE